MNKYINLHTSLHPTVYPKKYAHGFCFAVLCCGYTLTDFPISIRLTSLALWQSNDCPSASKATLMNMDKYFMWIHYERLHKHNKAKHNKTVCIFLGIYCSNAACNFMVEYCTQTGTQLHDHAYILHGGIICSVHATVWRHVRIGLVFVTDHLPPYSELRIQNAYFAWYGFKILC